MELTNILPLAKTNTVVEMYDGYEVRNGKVQGPFYSWQSSIDSVQKRYDRDLKLRKDSCNAPIWQRPFRFLAKAFSNLANMIANAFKTIFFCKGANQKAKSSQ